SSCIVILSIALPTSPQQPGKDQVQPRTSPYYPLTVGTQWTYQVGDHQVTVRVARSEVVEIKVQKPDADKKLKEEMVKVLAFQLEAKSDDRVQSETVAVLDDGVDRLAAAGKEIVPPL